jgi:hypothetical protein
MSRTFIFTIILFFIIIIIKNNIIIDSFTINCQKFPYLCSKKNYQPKYIPNSDIPDTTYWASKS